MATEKRSAGAAGGNPTASKVKGPASYFPSIEKTYGRPITEWQAIIRAHPDLRHAALVSVLKTDYGMGHGHANALVAHTLQEDATH